ncbi:MAG: hypothetical protein JWP02_1859 [Acidimicrobiales bacterium]|nr:hypothetical protein [Acidimicrobiales bacterium]
MSPESLEELLEGPPIAADEALQVHNLFEVAVGLAPGSEEPALVDKSAHRSGTAVPSQSKMTASNVRSGKEVVGGRGRGGIRHSGPASQDGALGCTRRPVI